MSTKPRKLERDLSERETLKLIGRYIADPPEGSRVLTITPAIAEHVLTVRSLENNRRRIASAVKRYASHMGEGEWRITGETIKFSVSGHLIDGQNRLAGCVASGVSFVTHVVFGIDDDAFDFMDMGKKRTPGHVLQIAGYRNAQLLAAAIRWAYLIDARREKRRDTLEASFILKLAREQYSPKIEGFISLGTAIHRVNPLIPPATAVALAYHFHRANPEKALPFLDAWARGSWGGKYKVFDRLSKRLRELHEASSGRINDVVRVALIVRAWNAFIEGRIGTSADFEWSMAEDTFPAIKG